MFLTGITSTGAEGWLFVLFRHCPVFFLFIHYSHATYLDHGEIMYSPFPVRCPRSGGSLQAPLLPPPTGSSAAASTRGTP